MPVTEPEIRTLEADHLKQPVKRVPYIGMTQEEFAEPTPGIGTAGRKTKGVVGVQSSMVTVWEAVSLLTRTMVVRLMLVLVVPPSRTDGEAREVVRAWPVTWTCRPVID